MICLDLNKHTHHIISPTLHTSDKTAWRLPPFGEMAQFACNKRAEPGNQSGCQTRGPDPDVFIHKHSVRLYINVRSLTSSTP